MTNRNSRLWRRIRSVIFGVALLAPSTVSALADAGGDGGGAAGGVGRGGAGSATSTGGTGSPGLAGGGGGGGAGISGGDGGPSILNSASGGLGATIAGGSGGVGGADGGGGGGGAHGAVFTNTTINAGAIAGGNGGNGGSGPLGFFMPGVGGGGGEGGYGVVVSGSGLSYINLGSTTGGTGGTGGFGTAPPGNGGDGGFGVFLTAGNALQNSGSIIGGNGGGRGFGLSSVGAAGAGGAGVIGSGLTIINSGSIAGGVSGDGITRANAITFTGGSNVLELQSGYSVVGNVIGTGADTLQLGGTASASFDVSTIGATAQYRGFSSFVKTGTGTWTLNNTTTATTPWTLQQGTLQLGNDGALGSGTLTFDGGKLQAQTGISERNIANAVQITANGGMVDSGSGFFRFTGNISDAPGSSGGTFFLASTGTGLERDVILAGNDTYSGITYIDTGTVIANSTTALSPNSAFHVNSGALLTLSGFSNTIASLADGTAGGGAVQNAAASGTATLTISGAKGGTNSFSGALRDGGAGEGGHGGPVLAIIKNGSSTQILTGVNQYSGATTVNGGVLQVEGSIAPSSMTTVNALSALTGTGTVGNTTIASGGTFAPGNGTPGASMTVSGSLALLSGAQYLVSLNPTTSSFATVTGTATLGGATVNASFASSSYVTRQYTILNSGAVSGSFGSLVNTNLPTSFTTSLSYDPTHAYLNLTLNFAGRNSGNGLNVNQQNVANALTNSFNSNGGIPLLYASLTPAGLTRASGELATSSQQTTFDAMGMFLSLLTDPFMGRGSGIGGSTGPSGYAAEGEESAYTASRRTSDAFAIFTKAPSAATFVQRWSVWAAGYGGSQTTDGNAAVGSNDTRSSVFGTAVGADYLFSPDTLAGFAIAGGGANFSVNNLGSGRSDLFQAGAYVRHTEGPAYITAALAYGWQDITTNRTVTAAGLDQLRAEFNANAYAGRVESGYRFVAPIVGGVGITPYAAGQFTVVDLPAYAESAIVGSSAFALNYGAKSVTDTRSELGFRADKSFAVANGILTLRGRLAWAHDFDPDRSIAATFQALPGASFVVNGAAQASDSALTTASAEWKWTSGWSAAATFEGEFSNVTRSYGGKGVVRYAW